VARTYTPEEIRAAIARVPRRRLAFLPTPLEACPRLSAELGVRLWIKRDDLTGLAFGGNKTRNLEFRLAEALAAGADTLIFGVEVTSNSARQTTAAANKLGLATVLFLRGDPPPGPPQGNLLLDLLLGAEVHFFHGDDAEMARVMAARAEELRRAGRRPFDLNAAPMFAVASALAYVECLLEVRDQLRALGASPQHVYMTSGSKGQAGLVLGRALLGERDRYRVVGVAVSKPGEDRRPAVAAIANAAAARIGLEAAVTPEEVESERGFVGPGYGVPTPEGMDAIRLLAAREGIFLDPVYTGKGMAALLADVRSGRIPPGSDVVFVHTGGTPALFSFADRLAPRLQDGANAKVRGD
jgi:1-aminocyclopropane-1-carboxylate deaminase/D-cysteine desulfhydrase-like pyridoxal-dependent ACC family enzyme